MTTKMKSNKSNKSDKSDKSDKSNKSDKSDNSDNELQISLDRINKKINQINTEFDPKQEYLDLFKFKTNESNNIKLDYLQFAIGLKLDRTKSIFQFMKFVNADVAIKIEMGILEYTLIKVSSEKITYEFITNIYNDKVRDISANLDMSNKRINNLTLTPSLNEGHIDPYFVGFLRPQQIHPAQWKAILDKRSAKELANNDIKVSDIYKCYRCGERKTTSYQMQVRSADEPMTTFVTCLVCYNTFTK
jgi:DNA-directed RNA polymerase subunit M/transcription elongation factor TFIIS